MSDALKRCVSILCLLVPGMLSAPVLADWYSNDPQLNQRQGFGDFPPATIDRDLQKMTNKNARPDSDLGESGDNPEPVSTAPESNVSSNTAGTVSTGNIYHPSAFPAPVYGGYPVGGPAAGPWYSRGPVYQRPRRGRSGSSPWGGRGWFW